MKAQVYFKVGLEVGKKMLATQATRMGPLEKGAGIVLGIMAVMKAEGIRVTVKLLEESEHVTKAFQEHDIPSEMLKPAVTEANKRWKKEGDEILLKPARNKRSKKSHSAPSLTENPSSSPDQTGADFDNDPSNSSSVYVDDVASDEL